VARGCGTLSPIMAIRQRILLKEWRNYRGLTQARLADRAGVTQGLISQLENDRTDYSGEVLAALADALACTPADLLIRNPAQPDAVWSIMDNLRSASPEEREQVRRVTDAMLKKAS